MFESPHLAVVIRRFLPTILVGLLVGGGASVSGGCKSRSTKGVVLVSAAISLRDAFIQAGRRFEKQNPGTRVQFNFASSGTLATQIIRGAPVDVFASASGHHMDRVARKGLVRTAHRHVLARNTLVIVQPRGHRKPMRSVADLRGAGRIAIGNPETVPAGRYARAMLRHHKLWSPLRRRLIYGEHVRQVLDYVVRNEVDAGLVYETDYRQRRAKLTLVATAAPGSHPPILYPVALLAGARQQKLALRFIRFLRSPQGQKILLQHGFGPGGSATP
jgi:molybdate transport system substrate-binding protein